jgi:hypothetical protein
MLEWEPRSQSVEPSDAPAEGANPMTIGTRVAWADYETVHNGRSCFCTGTIVAIDDGFILRERIQVGVDRDLGREVYDERSKALSLEQARHLLQE